MILLYIIICKHEISFGVKVYKKIHHIALLKANIMEMKESESFLALFIQLINNLFPGFLVDFKDSISTKSDTKNDLLMWELGY